MIDHTRHSAIFNVSDLDVCLIGAGGIGALTAITLGKMGVHNLCIYDDDTVDEVNLATQFHTVSDVGLKKAFSVTKATIGYSLAYAQGYDRRVDSSTHLRPFDVYVSSVDSIASRKEVWQAICPSAKEAISDERFMIPWYIDARIGAEIFEMLIVDMSMPGWYDHHISNASDDDIPDLPCTSKATIYTANIAAGHIGAAVRRISTSRQKPGLLKHDIIENNISFLSMGGSSV
jgi:molybdopterin/thiamine biosynthesis adenylyltransferase